MNTPERRQWRRSTVFIVNFENISRFSSISIVDFVHVFICWKIFRSFTNKMTKSTVYDF